MRLGRWRGHLLLAALLAALGACTAAPPATDGEPVPASPAAYPDLADVPARPRLTYSVAQRRDIGKALVADRANAEYARAELAYQQGRTSLPPPPGGAEPEAAASAQPPATPPAPPAPLGGGGRLAAAYVDESIERASDDGEFDSFLDRLQRPPPDTAGPPSVAAAFGLEEADRAAPVASFTEPPTPAGPADAAPAESPAAAGGPGPLERFGSFLGGILGMEAPEAQAAEPPAPPPPAPAAEASAPPAPATPDEPPPVIPAPVPLAPLPPAPAAASVEPAPAALPPAPPPPAPVAALAAPAATPPPPPPAPVKVLPIGTAVARLAFPSGSAGLDPAAVAQLEQAVAYARAARAGLRIVAEPADGPLGADRARNVAAELMRHGAPSGWLDLDRSGSGDAAVVYLARRGSG